MKTTQITREEITTFEIWSSYINFKKEVVEFQDKDLKLEILKNGKFTELDFYSLIDDCDCEFRQSTNGQLIEDFETLNRIIKSDLIYKTYYDLSEDERCL